MAVLDMKVNFLVALGIFGEKLKDRWTDGAPLAHEVSHRTLKFKTSCACKDATEFREVVRL